MTWEKTKRWLWLPIALVWALGAAVWFWPELEPLTGIGPGHYFLNVLIFAFFSGAGIHVGLNRRKYTLGCLLLILALTLFIPMPSKAGVNIGIENQTTNAPIITIQRTDDPVRRVAFPIFPSRITLYRIAPGDWLSSAGLLFTCGTNQISASISDLRHKHMRLTSDGFELRDAVAP